MNIMNSNDLYEKLKVLIPNLPNTCISLELKLAANIDPTTTLVTCLTEDDPSNFSGYETEVTTFKLVPDLIDVTAGKACTSFMAQHNLQLIPRFSIDDMNQAEFLHHVFISGFNRGVESAQIKEILK